MRKGFTLIELVMVIIILGILAATALPRFIDLTGAAKDSAAKATLGNMRAAVSVQYAQNAVNGVSPLIPTQLTGDMFADGKVPLEPYSDTNAVKVVDTGVTPTLATGGWMYDKYTGRVYLNDTTSGRNNW